MEMGRPRQRARAGWPDNVTTGGGGYYYRRPDTGERKYMGQNQAAVFVAARKLNALLAPKNDLVEKIIGRTETIDDAIKVFREEDVPGREWADATASLYDNILDRMSTAIGKRECEGFSVRDCATFIREVTESKRARQQFRLALQWVLACAVEEGWIETNPALQVRKAINKRQRERLVKAVYDKIHTAAPMWLQNAMDLSLCTLLRREDVTSLRFTDVRDGVLSVIPGKTEHSTGARLRIAYSDNSTLGRVIARCRDNIVSPYLVHRIPERINSAGQKARKRDHHTQLLPEQISRGFAEVRDGLYPAWENAPTFHEIRSLGGALLIEAGWTKKQVQDLMTHTSESMTEHYLDGHEKPWTEISVG